MDVAMVPATVARVAVTGELGYEVTCAANQVRAGDELSYKIKQKAVQSVHVHVLVACTVSGCLLVGLSAFRFVYRTET